MTPPHLGASPTHNKVVNTTKKKDKTVTALHRTEKHTHTLPSPVHTRIRPLILHKPRGEMIQHDRKEDSFRQNAGAKPISQERRKREKGRNNKKEKAKRKKREQKKREKEKKTEKKERT